MFKANSIKTQDNIYGWLFIAPALLGFVLFFFLPAVSSFVFSFSRYRVPDPPIFVGLENFIKLFSRDKAFGDSLKATFFFWLLYVPVHLFVALFLAIILNEPLKGKKAFRTLYFVPYITPMIAVSFIWMILFDSEWGLINFYIKELFGAKVDWLAEPIAARFMLAFVEGWKSVGFPTLIFLAAMQGVPRELYEMAEIEGAPLWRRIFQITVPYISPSIFYMFVVSSIHALQTFDTVYLMTQGGPARATLLYSFHIYQVGFRMFRLGYANAMSVVLFSIIAFITFINFRLQKHWVHYE